MRYSAITCPFCGQQTQFDYDSPSCYCIRCAQMIERNSTAASGGLLDAADKALLSRSFEEAQALYANAILSGSTDPCLYIRKAVCGVFLSRDQLSMNELISTYARCDSELRADPAALPQRKALANELLRFLQSDALFLPRDSNAQPFLNVTEAQKYCQTYSAALDLVKDLYKYVPYDLLDEREALSRFTQQFCTIGGLRVYHFTGGGRSAIVMGSGTRMVANQVWRDCAGDLAYIQSLRVQQAPLY